MKYQVQTQDSNISATAFLVNNMDKLQLISTIFIIQCIQAPVDKNYC